MPCQALPCWQSCKGDCSSAGRFVNILSSLLNLSLAQAPFVKGVLLPASALWLFLDLVAPIRFFWSHARPQCLAGARSLCLRWCDIAGCLLYLAAVVLRSYAGWQPGGTCRHACVHTDSPACGAVTAREQDQSHWRDAASSYSMAGPLGYGHLSKPPGFALTWAEKLCARRCRASTSTRTGWTNAPGHIFPWPPCVQLCPAQEKLVKVTPDDALEGTCWQEQPLLCACCDLHGSNYFLGASNICLDPFSFRKLLIRYRMGRCNEKKMGPIFERASHVDSVLLITNEADPPCSKNPEMKCGEHVILNPRKVSTWRCPPINVYSSMWGLSSMNVDHLPGVSLGFSTSMFPQWCRVNQILI